jgi:hypothetical protein
MYLSHFGQVNGRKQHFTNLGNAILLRTRTWLRSDGCAAHTSGSYSEWEITLVRYFLHQTYEAMHVPDTDGECFLDLQDAEKEAVLSARQIVGDTLMRGGHPNFGKIQICDDAGTVLKEVSFRAAILGS